MLLCHLTTCFYKPFLQTMSDIADGQPSTPSRAVGRTPTEFLYGEVPSKETDDTGDVVKGMVWTLNNMVGQGIVTGDSRAE